MDIITEPSIFLKKIIRLYFYFLWYIDVYPKFKLRPNGLSILLRVQSKKSYIFCKSTGAYGTTILSRSRTLSLHFSTFGNLQGSVYYFLGSRNELTRASSVQRERFVKYAPRVQRERSLEFEQDKDVRILNYFI